MKHIVFLSDDQPVCENPARLGEDWFRGQDGSLDPTCKMCTALVFAYSRQAEKIDANKIAGGHISAERTDAPAGFVKGFVYGTFIMAVIAIMVILAWVMFS